MKIEHYVEYLYPGSLFAEESAHKIDAPRDLEAAMKHLQPGAFAFSFYDLRIREGKLEDGEKITDKKRINESGRWYPDGGLYTLPEVRALGPDLRTVASNMECNGWDRVVKTRRGNWQPFLATDALISTAPSNLPAPTEARERGLPKKATK